jgi:hypothetical protein
MSLSVQLAAVITNLALAWVDEQLCMEAASLDSVVV